MALLSSLIIFIVILLNSVQVVFIKDPVGNLRGERLSCFFIPFVSVGH